MRKLFIVFVLLVGGFSLANCMDSENATRGTAGKTGREINSAVTYTFNPGNCEIKPNSSSISIHPAVSTYAIGGSVEEKFYLLINDGKREWLERSPCDYPVITKTE